MPPEWLQQLTERLLSEEEKRRVEALGGWDKLLETLRQRLREQQGRHEGGNKWIGTAGTSPFGNQGFNPEGVRIGQAASRHRRAVKVWEARDYRNLDDGVALGTRNLKMALRRLRRLAREGAAEELDLDGTIDATARNAGLLDLQAGARTSQCGETAVAARRGRVHGSSHQGVRRAVFGGTRGVPAPRILLLSQFPVRALWKDNRRRFSEITDTAALLRTFNADYRALFIGDATMSPYEIEQPGGSVEHWNEESGRVWMTRIAAHFPRLVWLNPEPEERWKWTPSVEMTRELVGGRMFPLTLEGLDRAMRELKRRGAYTALTLARAISVSCALLIGGTGTGPSRGGAGCQRKSCPRW